MIARLENVGKLPKTNHSISKKLPHTSQKDLPIFIKFPCDRQKNGFQGPCLSLQIRNGSPLGPYFLVISYDFINILFLHQGTSVPLAKRLFGAIVAKKRI
jgi:hypothetical protein